MLLNDLIKNQYKLIFFLRMDLDSKVVKLAIFKMSGNLDLNALSLLDRLKILLTQIFKNLKMA